MTDGHEITDNTEAQPKAGQLTRNMGAGSSINMGAGSSINMGTGSSINIGTKVGAYPDAYPG